MLKWWERLWSFSTPEGRETEAQFFAMLRESALATDDLKRYVREIRRERQQFQIEGFTSSEK